MTVLMPSGPSALEFFILRMAAAVSSSVISSSLVLGFIL